MIPIITGIVSTLLQAGLPKIAQAVVDKGLDYVEEKTGIKLEPEMSQEKIAQLKAEAQKHEEFLTQEANKNTSDARSMNSSIQSSGEASSLSKNAAYIIDFIIVAAAVILSGICFFVGIPLDNKEIVYTALGSLYTLTGTVINFHRGSSYSSQSKQVQIDNFIKEKK